MNAIARERNELVQPHLATMPADDQEAMQVAINDAKQYKPKTMMKCITDVVSQNLWAAMRSIGGVSKAKAAYQRIRSEIEAPAQNVQDDVIPPNAIMV